MTDKLITEDFHKVSNPNFEGECANELRQIEVLPIRGVLGLFCDEKQQIKTYLFDKTEWTMAEAKDWTSEHAKDSTPGIVKGMIQKDSEEGENIKLSVVASNEVEDRDGEVLAINGWELDNFKSNPVILWMHNRATGHNGLPIGKASNVRVGQSKKRRALLMDIELDESTEFNRTVARMVGDGLLNTVSVGFLPFEMEGNKFTRQELLEVSVVPVPSNHTAEFQRSAKALGFKNREIKSVIENKSTVPFRAYSPAPEAKKWNPRASKQGIKAWAGGTTKDEIDFNAYKEVFAWVDQENKKDFKSYKLPHHIVEGTKLLTSFKGVVNAMASLLGAKGGTSIPSGDRRAVYNHLAKHYEQFDKEAPAYSLVESQELRELFEIHEDMVKDATEVEMVKNIRQIKAEIKKVKQERLRERNTRSKLVDDLTKALSSKLDKAIEELKTSGK